MNVEVAVRFAERRLRLARARRDATRAFVLAAGAAGVVVAILALAGRLGDVARVPLLLTTFAVPALAGAVVFLVRLRSARDGEAGAASLARAAVELDRRLALDERVSTARALDGDEGRDDVRNVVLAQADHRLGEVGPNRLGAVFPLPSLRPAAFAAVALSTVALVAPSLPPIPGLGTGAAAPNSAAALRERQEVREEARRLEKSAAEIERAAERAALERAKRAARQLADEARRLETDAPGKRDALVRLAKVGDALERAKSELLSARGDGEAGDAGDPFGAAAGDDALEELARELSRLDPEGLTADLDALTRELRERSGAGRAEEGAAGADERLPIDRRRVRDLMDRTEELRSAFERLRDELAARDAEAYQSLAQEASERLSELLEELRRLDRLAELEAGQQGSPGALLTSEELAALEEMLERLAKMSDEEFAELMQMLREMQGLEALQCALGRCQGGLGGSGGGAIDGERLSALLRRLSSQGAGDGRQGGGGDGGQGPSHGLGQGGRGERAPDDGRGEEPTRVRGQLDPTGDLGPRIPFRGIPNRNEAKRAFDEALLRAAAEAEESLGRDLLPPESRPFVRRYFESLRDASSSDGR